ncbi:MAG: hypothetical protein ACXW3L_01260 [Limisphaerales bacterium]
MKTRIARNFLSATNAAAFLAGITMLGGLNASAQSTNLLSQTTFDPEAASPWGYGYFYGNNGLGLQSYNSAYYLPEDVDLTNAMWQFTFDLTDLVGATGYGTGTGGPLHRTETDPAAFVSGDRANYIFTFDARVEGLEPSQTGNGEMQVQFYIPGETEVQKVLQVNIPFAPTAEWQTFSFHLDEGSVSGDSNESSFSTNHTSTSEIRFNVNFHEPHSRFGYDSENALYLDNVKLEVIDKPTAPPVETVPVTMAEWNFDNLPVFNEYHYDWSANENRAIVTAGNNANGADPNTLGKNESSGWSLNLDTTSFLFDTPAWAGAGTGGGGPVDYTLFDSPDLADYRVTFDARVLGLAPDRATSAAVLQLHMDSPDDTVAPDENTDADFIVRLDFPIAQVSPEWQTYTYLLSKANVGSGSKALFSAHHAAITGFRTQWQIENATDIAAWGYDEENTLIIDNFKLDRLIPADTGDGPTLNGTHESGQLVLTWATPSGSNVRLQSSDTVDGEYNNVEGATSGYSAPTTGNARFFRLVQTTN